MFFFVSRSFSLDSTHNSHQNDIHAEEEHAVAGSQAFDDGNGVERCDGLVLGCI